MVNIRESDASSNHIDLYIIKKNLESRKMYLKGNRYIFQRFFSSYLNSLLFFYVDTHTLFVFHNKILITMIHLHILCFLTNRPNLYFLFFIFLLFFFFYNKILITMIHLHILYFMFSDKSAKSLLSSSSSPIVFCYLMLVFKLIISIYNPLQKLYN